MKLLEFYAMNEGSSEFFTIEPDGRLLLWREDAGDEDGRSAYFEVEETGDINAIIARLRKLLPSSAQHEDIIRQAFEQGQANGDAVYLDKYYMKQGKIDFMAPADDKQQMSEPGYEDDNPNSYF